MSRYIDADALKVSITKYGALHISHKKLPMVKNEARELIRDICFAIEAQSTADVVPVVYGKWVLNENDDMFYCTNCKNGSVRNDYPYCHWCGAKMDEVTE